MKLKVESLSKKFKDNQLWKDLNFEISSGEIVCITGHSGSGKTTLLNCIGLLEKATSGKIFFDDKDVTNLNYFSKKYFFRNTLGFLFQNYGLIDTWTVNQNLNIALAYKKFKRAEREEKKLLSLRKVAISGKKNKKVYTLSGGEQQRLALARLILKDAKIILCDEPSAALDADNVQNIIDILKTLAKEGAIVVISTHDQFVVNQCDRQINLDSIS